MVLQPFTGNGIGEMQRVHVSRSKIPFNIRDSSKQSFSPIRFHGMSCAKA